MLARLRLIARENKFLRRFIGHILPSTGFFDSIILGWKINDHWRRRIEIVKSCPDNIKIQRVPNAGQVKRGVQVLHNGIKINVGSYYGPEKTVMLHENFGVHEPQEELVFKQVIEYLREKTDAQHTMLELGSFWSFYSAWFASELKSSKNIMVEPDPFNMESGVRNFALNELDGTFINAFVNDFHEICSSEIRTISVDGLTKELNIESLTILHSDIQGYENNMLKGASDMLSAQACEFVFVSTHSTEVHLDCRSKLEAHDYRILTDIDVDQSYSDDGLIFAVAKHSYFELRDIPVARR